MKIAQYDALTHHLDQDNIIDLKEGKSCGLLISQIINKNYYNFKELEKVIGLDGLDPSEFLGHNKLIGFDFFSTPEYIMAKTQGLQLITNDINKVHIAINSLMSFRKSLEIRTERELPNLIHKAEALITLLKETYLN